MQHSVVPKHSFCSIVFCCWLFDDPWCWGSSLLMWLGFVGGVLVDHGHLGYKTHDSFIHSLSPPQQTSHGVMWHTGTAVTQWVEQVDSSSKGRWFKSRLRAGPSCMSKCPWVRFWTPPYSSVRALRWATMLKLLNSVHLGRHLILRFAFFSSMILTQQCSTTLLLEY